MWLVGKWATVGSVILSSLSFATLAGAQDAAGDSPVAPPAVQDAETQLSGDATKVRPYVTRQGKEAQLRLTSQPEGLTFHRQTGSAIAVGTGGQAYATGYERLCTAPCDITLPAGTEVLAVSEGNEAPRIAEPISFPAGESRLVGRLESRAGTRIAGWTIVGASVVVGAVLFYSSISSTEVCGEDYGTGYGRSCHTQPDVSLPLLLTGALLPAVGIPVGIMLGVRRDAAKVELARSRPSEALPTLGLTLRTAL
jgi:hypothetical protein